EKHRTPNIEHPTPNAPNNSMFGVGCSMLDVRCWMFDVGCPSGFTGSGNWEKEAGEFAEMASPRLRSYCGISIRHRSPRTTGRSIAAPCRRSWNWPTCGHRERKPVLESDSDDP